MLSTQSPSSGILQLNLKPDNNMGFKSSALAQDRFCCSLTRSARTGVIGKGGRRRTVVTPVLHGWGIEGWVAQPHWCIICAVTRGILWATEAQVTSRVINCISKRSVSWATGKPWTTSSGPDRQIQLPGRVSHSEDPAGAKQPIWPRSPNLTSATGDTAFPLPLTICMDYFHQLLLAFFFLQHFLKTRFT